ncbi:FUSC family protein [Micrococcus sp.]|uniref:FUSC family protein n=1 Tax=Micrococcus sp. TaxID=1271 RepID=UPI002A9085EA|nr:FUSC family protein [Micrococcus sp.]MDY6056035.1 FUSC family protein [Micrococcus sp.]
MTDRIATATGTVPIVAPSSRTERTRQFLVRRARAGRARVRSSVGQALLLAVCSVGAYAFAEQVLGHPRPLFASTALLIALGFQREPRLRRVAEVAVGCTLGILIGDLLMLGLGRGVWQAAVVVFVSLLVARFLDSGQVFTTQMSLQSVLVVLLPPDGASPFARSQDAVVGGVLALIVTFLSPKNAARGPVSRLQGLHGSMAQVLRDLSHSLRHTDSGEAWMALVTGRTTQSALDDLRKELRLSREQVQFNPLQRNVRGMVEAANTAVDRTDLALRSMRIVARRVVSLLDNDGLDDEHRELLAVWFDEAADAVEVLNRSLSEPQEEGRHRSLTGARDALGAAASRLDPHTLGGGTVHGEALVMLLRPMMVDLLESTGASHADAVAYLPRV